jgi:predicted nucleotidyltransferase
MTARQFYDWQTLGGSSDVAAIVAVLEQRGVPWCMIGGLAVNHWAHEPMATADVDLVIATNRVTETTVILCEEGFTAEHFPYSINLKGNSKVSIQISTEEFYQAFPQRSVAADVHGILMRVASCEDTLTGKIAAFSDASRRPSKRQKDLADIARLIEAHPHLQAQIPPEIYALLIH